MNRVECPRCSCIYFRKDGPLASLCGDCAHQLAGENAVDGPNLSEQAIREHRKPVVHQNVTVTPENIERIRHARTFPSA